MILWTFIALWSVARTDDAEPDENDTAELFYLAVRYRKSVLFLFFFDSLLYYKLYSSKKLLKNKRDTTANLTEKINKLPEIEGRDEISGKFSRLKRGK